MADQLLLPKQAAEFLQISPSTLASWRCYGNGPAWVKVGLRSVRYRMDALVTWIEDQERNCHPEIQRKLDERKEFRAMRNRKLRLVELKDAP